MKKTNTGNDAKPSSASRIRLRRAMEALATFGLILVAVGLAAPFFNTGDVSLSIMFKWIFAAGALMFTAARVTGSLGRDGSVRVRRLRRMETWAGLAFCTGAFFWFYNTSRIDSDVLTFRMLNETVIFTLAGAFIQIVASWMLSSAIAKDAAADAGKSRTGDSGKK